jgi:hypothetical protein
MLNPAGSGNGFVRLHDGEKRWSILDATINPEQAVHVVLHKHIGI